MRLRHLFPFLSLTITVAPLHAATLLWDATPGGAPNNSAQDGSGTWSLGPNWRNTGTSSDDQSFVNGDTVTFGAGSGAAGTVTVNQAGGVSTNSITFNAAGTGSYIIAGSGTTGTINMTAGTLAVNADATINAIVGGTGTLTKTGTGKLTLGGANTFTGQLAVTAGTVNLQNNNASGTTAGGILVSNNATLELQGGITVANGDSLTINGAGVASGGALRNVSGNNTYRATVTLGSASQITAEAGSLTITNTISGAQALTVTSGASATLTFSGVIQQLTALHINLHNTSSLTISGTENTTTSAPIHLNSGTLILNRTSNSDRQLPAAIANNTTVNIGNGSASVVLRLGNHNQIGDTGTVLNFGGIGANSGILRTDGRNDTIGTVRSAVVGAGIIENNHASTASTLTVNNATNDTYSGLIRNGAAAALHLTKTNTGTLSLTGTNSFTGATTVRNGTLELSGATSTLTASSSYTIGTGGTLKLTNTATNNVSNRLGDATATTLTGGTLWQADDGTSATYTESIGAVQAVAGASTLSTVSSAGGSTTLTAVALQRSKGATLQFQGTNLGTGTQSRILFSSVPSQTDHGLIGGWAITGNEFAKYDTSLGVTALFAADYITSGEANWKFDTNAKQTTSTTLGEDRHVNSLNLQQSSATTINLGGNALRVESGGILISGAYNSAITTGTLTAGTSDNTAGELIIHQNSAANTLDIGANITDNDTGSVALVKGGAGTVRLSGANDFTGGIYVNAGKLELGGANAIGTNNVSMNTLAVEGGTLDLNGQDLTVASLSSQSSNTAGMIINSTGGTKTLTAGSNHASTGYHGGLGSTGLNFVKTGNGVLDFNQQNAAFSGIITVSAGTLRASGATAFGTSTGAADKTIIMEGATLDIANGFSRNERLDIAGHGVNGLGAIIANSGESQNILYGTLTGHTTLSVNVRYDFDNQLAGNGFTLTKVGGSELSLEGAQVQGLGDVHVKQAQINWSGSADLGDSNKTLYVDAGAAAQFYNHGDDAKHIVLNGGILRRSGDSTVTTNEIDVVDGLQLAAGASTIVHSGSLLVFQLNAIDRDIGSTLNVDNRSDLATTDSPLVNGIVGGYLTMGNTDWATKVSASNDAFLTAYTAYATNDFAIATNNTTVSGTQTPGAGFTVNTLRFNAASTVLNLSGINTISTGGILVTSAGGGASIAGGTLRGSENGDLIVINHGNFAISSVIADNSGATALTKSAGGTLTLSGNNTYTGGTYLNAGTISVALIADSGNSHLGNSSGEDDNLLVFNGGTLSYTGTVNTVTSRNVKLLSGGGTFSVNSGRELDLSGQIYGDAYLTGEGTYINEARLIKTGAGTLTLSGSSANGATGFIGRTEINEGILKLNKTAGVNALAKDVTIGNNSGGLDILLLAASDQIADTAVITFNGTGTNVAVFRLAGNTEVVGGLNSAAAGHGIIENEAAGNGTVQAQVAANTSYTFSGTLRNGDGTGTDGTLGLTKSGDGTQILTGTNTYTGTTSIEGGVLQLGDGGTTGSIANTSTISFSTGGNLTVNRSNALTIGQALTGDGSFTQAGSGTTTLTSGASTYSGNTRVTAGSLLVNNTVGSATGTGDVYVTGGLLAGNGRIGGSVFAQESGIVNPGDAAINNGIGTLTVDGNFHLKRSAASEPARLVMQLGNVSSTVFNDAANLMANIGDLPAYFATAGVLDLYEAESGTHDRLLVGGIMSFDPGARIVVDNSLGYQLKLGDVLDLFDWDNLVTSPELADRAWSTDLDLLLPTLSSALRYDLSLFDSNGIVIVVPEPGRLLLVLLGMLTLLARRRR